MFRNLTYHRLLLVALVAMAGTVLSAPDALASSPGTGGGSCCASPMPEDCHCCESAMPAPAAAALVTPGAATSVLRPVESCECRTAPAQPAHRDSRQDSRTTEDRSTESIDELPLASALCHPRRAFASPAFASPPPLRAALYLRIERLLL